MIFTLEIPHEGKPSCRVYCDEVPAMDALYNDPLLCGKGSFYAHMALREQLTAWEVLSDDL
jgi:hypothetical protein